MKAIMYAVLIIMIGVSACHYETEVNKPTRPASQESAWFEFSAKKTNTSLFEITIVNTKPDGKGFAYTNRMPSPALLVNDPSLYDLRLCFADTLVILADKDNTLSFYQFQENADGSGIGLTWVTAIYVQKFFGIY